MLDLPSDIPPTRQMSTAEAGVIAQRHARTVVTWIRTGKLAAFRLPGDKGQYRILWKDLKALLERQYVPRK